MDFDWKRPFEIAFEFGLWTIGWTLVAIIGLIALTVFIATVKAVLVAFRGKKISKAEQVAKALSGLQLVKGNAKKD